MAAMPGQSPPSARLVRACPGRLED